LPADSPIVHSGHVGFVSLFSHSSARDCGTFRPTHTPAPRIAKLQEIKDSLPPDDLVAAVKLPPGEDLNDWLASGISQFYNELSSLYAPISQLCTAGGCPEMTAGAGFKYYWQDNRKFKKPTMLPAPQYITNVFLWAEKLLQNEKVFPGDEGQDYPANFKDVVSNIFKRLFRIYAHCFHHHLADFRRLGLEGTLNSRFRNFALFSKEFQLIPDQELAALREIYDFCTS
jgi:MOB kinase activator 1